MNLRAVHELRRTFSNENCVWGRMDRELPYLIQHVNEANSNSILHRKMRHVRDQQGFCGLCCFVVVNKEPITLWMCFTLTLGSCAAELRPRAQKKYLACV